MNGFHACLQTAGVLSVLLLSAVSLQAQPASVASSEQVARTAVVRDIQVRGGTVSGVVVNTSPRLLRDVKVVVRHTWHWKNERHPGEDNPGRAERKIIAGEVPPNGSLPFTIQLDQPLPRRADGYFDTSADVISFTEVGN